MIKIKNNLPIVLMCYFNKLFSKSKYDAFYNFFIDELLLRPSTWIISSSFWSMCCKKFTISGIPCDITCKY